MTKVTKTNDEYAQILKTISSKIKNLDENEIEVFFRAFLTPSEILEICDRYLIVKELLQGKSHRKIAQEIGVSVSKIASGSRELKFGYGKQIYKKFIGE